MARAKLLLQEIETYAQKTGDTIRVPTRARTTPASPPLLDKALEELATCLGSLSLAEEVIRVQNVALKELRHVRHAERRRYRDLLACVPDVLVITDADGLILETNPAAATRLSRSKSLRAGKPVTRFFTHDKRLTLLGVLRATGDGMAWEGGLCLKPRVGPAFWAAVTVTPTPAIRDTPATLLWLIRPA